MRTCLFGVLALVTLGVATARAQGVCYYNFAQVWVCDPGRPAAYYWPYYRRADCWKRHGRWVCGSAARYRYAR